MTWPPSVREDRLRPGTPGAAGYVAGRRSGRGVRAGWCTSRPDADAAGMSAGRPRLRAAGGPAHHPAQCRHPEPARRGGAWRRDLGWHGRDGSAGGRGRPGAGGARLGCGWLGHGVFLSRARVWGTGASRAPVVSGRDAPAGRGRALTGAQQGWRPLLAGLSCAAEITPARRRAPRGASRLGCARCARRRGAAGGDGAHRGTAAAAAARPGGWPGGLHRASAKSAGGAAMRAS
jgi:hypothetical protein